MANSDRRWQGEAPLRAVSGYNRYDYWPLDNYQVNDGIPSANLYPDEKNLLKDDYVPSSRDTFPVRSEPPWQKRREEYGLRQDPRANTTPNPGSDRWSNNPQDWNRQRGSLNQQSMINSQGVFNRDENAFKEDDGWGYRRDDDQLAQGNELSGWNNLPPRPNVSSIRSQPSFESNQMSKYNNPASVWTSPLSKPIKPLMWGNRFQEHDNRPDMMDRSYGQTGLNEPREWDREEHEWSGRSHNDSDNIRQSDWIAYLDRKASQQQEWSDRSYRDVPGQMSRSNVSAEWRDFKNEQRLREIENKNVNFKRLNSAAKGPAKRNFDMMSGKGFNKQNVWNRLDNRLYKDESFESNKRQKTSEQFNMGGSGDASTQQKVELTPNFGGVPSGSLKIDLRDKISKRETSTSEELKSIYNIIFFPLDKKSKFRIGDLAKLREKLIGELYKMARSDDLERQPQLRFKSFKMVSKTQLVMECEDAATASWVLRWDYGWTRFPVRRSLVQDLNRLAFISFVMKGHNNISTEGIKPVLKLQNPGLDVSAWSDGGTRNTKKGTTYVFRVDGNSIRYLTRNSWGIYFGLNRFHVRRLRSNFVYAQEEFLSI